MKSGWVIYGPENGYDFPYPCLLMVNLSDLRVMVAVYPTASSKYVTELNYKKKHLYQIAVDNNNNWTSFGDS